MTKSSRNGDNHATALDAKEVGQRIAAARDAKGWNQVAFAAEAGCSPSTVSRWERGYLPPVRELMRAAALLDVPAETLLELPDEPPGLTERLDRIEALLERIAQAVGMTS